MWRGRTRTEAWVCAVGIVVAAGAMACDTHSHESRSEAGGGEVIGGICPAEMPPKPVTSTDSYDDFDDDWVVEGTAYADKVDLTWPAPNVQHITGYLVVRLGIGWDRGIEPGSLLTFTVDGTRPRDTQEVHFTDDSVSANRPYLYRVFPVSADSVGNPSQLLEIWTPQVGVPTAPSRVEAFSHRWGIGIDVWFGRRESPLGVRIARREGDNLPWRIIQETDVPDGFADYPRWSYYWSDQDAKYVQRSQYAVCLINAHGIGPATVAEWVDENPANNGSTPNPVSGLEVLSTTESALLTWNLPEVPNLTGLEITEDIIDHDIRNLHLVHPVLESDETAYHATTSKPYWNVRGVRCFRVRTFNDYGIESLGELACVEPTVPATCNGHKHFVSYDDHLSPPLFPSINLLSCEETGVQVIRHDIAAKGPVTTMLMQPCKWRIDWSEYPERYLACEYLDRHVEPSTWYLYELSQTFRSGYKKTTVHQVLTRPEQESG